MVQSFSFDAATRPSSVVDHDQVIAGVRLLLAGLGVNPQAADVENTPRRVAQMYEELFQGLMTDPDAVLDVSLEEEYDELVLVRNIRFTSVCQHHLFPFFGQAHVGYLPNEQGYVTRLSKLARLIDVLTRRPTIQERATTEIADSIDRALFPRGILVVLEAEQLCMTLHGARAPGSRTVTSAARGLMRRDTRTRAEVMALISRGSRT
jgi:GTP cyclohydrolase I